MRRKLIAAVLVLACGHAAASGTQVNVSCDVESDYDFALSERSVIFTRDRGTPGAIVMRNGRLFVDDRWVTLSAADRARVVSYEREARALMPLAQQVGREAADIAFIALGEVAMGFSSNPADTRAKLDAARKQIDTRLARSVTPTRYSSEALGEGIGDAVRQVMPTVVGDIVGGAMRAALGGDTERLKRLENLDKDLEARIAPRAKALERNAQDLCSRMQALDAIDNALEYRLANGKPLDLLRVKQRDTTRN
jgi:hypothetical protein